MSVQYDLAIVGGRVIDPETEVDALKTVGVRNGRIAYLDYPAVEADRVIDASNRVVCPGFVDLHSHAQSITGLRLQALDGVTTSLELEGGALPVRGHCAWAEQQGRPINFGYSASWAAARMQVLDAVAIARPRDGDNASAPIDAFERYQAGPRWRGPADGAEIAQILASVRDQLRDGAIGVGVLAGYAPESTLDEFHALAGLASEVDQPLFVHARSMADRDHGGSVDAVRELVDASKRFDAPIHLCHMNSTSGLRLAQVTDELHDAQQAGVRITAEAYPYSAGSTVIGAAFLDPGKLHESNLQPDSITYLRTGERVSSSDRLAELRAEDPGGICVLDTFDLAKPDQRALLLRALTFPNAAIASDAMQPVFWGSEDQRQEAERAITEDVWPLPPGLIAHPRSSGCFSKALSWLAREEGALTLGEVIRRTTLVPADILAGSAPSMRSKGRLQVGADADIVVFDDSTVAAGGDYKHLRPSTGIEHVIVGGTPVVRDAELVVDALPGKPVRGTGFE